MSPTTIQFLRFVHIVGGAFWLGSILFAAIFLLPAVRAAGPAGGLVMHQIVEVRKLPIYMMFIPMITVVAGLGLYWNDSAGFSGQWMHSGPGMTFGLGAVLGITVAILGMTVNGPISKRLATLGAEIRQRGGPPTGEEQAEMQRLQKKFGIAMQVAAVLIILAGAAMALARYMPS